MRSVNILNNAFINHPDGLPLAKMGRLLQDGVYLGHSWLAK